MALPPITVPIIAQRKILAGERGIEAACAGIR